MDRISPAFKANTHNIKKELHSKKNSIEHIKPETNFARPSLEHFKANFITFKGQENDSSTEVVPEEEAQNTDIETSTEQIDNQIPQDLDPYIEGIRKLVNNEGISAPAAILSIADSIKKVLTDELNRSLIPANQLLVDLTQKANNGEAVDFPHYGTTAEECAINLTTSHDVALQYKKGATPEYVAHDFAQKLTSGDFKNQGLTKDDTKVYYLDIPELTKNQQNVEIVLESLSRFIENQTEERPKEKVVIFIKNMDQPLFFTREYKNIKSVSMIQKQEQASSPMMLDTSGNLINNEPDLPKGYVALDLTPPSVKDTIHFYKSRMKEFIDSIKEETGFKALAVDLSFGPEAFSEIFNMAAKYEEGEFPGKATTFANKIIRTVIQHKEIKNGKTKITVEDLKKAVAEYPEMFTIPKSKSGKFKVVESTGVKFKDVAGLKTVKEEVTDKVLGYLKNPEPYIEVGAELPKGAVLYGPPGNGKTLFARAIAGEANVPFVQCNASQFNQSLLGAGKDLIDEMFDFAAEQARKNESKTAIIFIDEIDALAGKRGGIDSHSENSSTLNEFLNRMDGFNNNNGTHIFVIAATNRQDSLDEAAMREVRFDYKWEIPNIGDDKNAIKEILKVQSSKKKFEPNEKAQILKKTEPIVKGWSGAKIKTLLNDAALIAATKPKSERFITLEDITTASKNLKGFVKPERGMGLTQEL